VLTSVNRYKKEKKVYTFELMLEKNYKNIIYFISIAIVATIIAQVYWNIKNYEINKQQINNQIQISFDNSVEKYYSEIAKNDVFNRFPNNTRSNDDKWIKSSAQKINMFIDASRDSIDNRLPKTISYYSSVDTIPFKLLEHSNRSNLDSLFIAKIDSTDLNELTTKIILSFQEDTIELKKVDSLFNLELERKNLTLNHGFNFEHTSHFSSKKEIKTYQLENLDTNFLSTKSNSSFLPPNSILELRYKNPTNEVFKKIAGSILLSFLLSGIIIGCLLYLFKTIARQKQLS
jgi:two-component system phosphate regulon sensor histidine kinase PhoR